MQRVSILEQYQRALADDLRLVEEKMRQRRVLQDRSAARIKKRAWEMRSFEAMLRRRDAEEELLRKTAMSLEQETNMGALPEHDICTALLNEQRKFGELLKIDPTAAWETEFDDSDRIQAQREERRVQNRKTDRKTIRHRAVMACRAAEQAAAKSGRPWGYEASAFARYDMGDDKEIKPALIIDLEGPSLEDMKKDVHELAEIYRERCERIKLEKLMASSNSKKKMNDEMMMKIRHNHSLSYSLRKKTEESRDHHEGNNDDEVEKDSFANHDDDYGNFSDGEDMMMGGGGTTSMLEKSRLSRPSSASSIRSTRSLPIQKTITASLREKLGQSLRNEPSAGESKPVKFDKPLTNLSEEEKELNALRKKIAERPAWAAGEPRQLPRTKPNLPRPVSAMGVYERVETKRRPVSAPLRRKEDLAAVERTTYNGSNGNNNNSSNNSNAAAPGGSSSKRGSLVNS